MSSTNHVVNTNQNKTFILDTNVLLSDVNFINSFGKNNIVIPLAVLEELDNNKKRSDEVGRNARVVCRKLDEFREKGSLYNWVQLESGGLLCVMQNKGTVSLPSDLDPNKNDNLVIQLALELHEIKPIVVSKDINVRVKCDSLGISAQDYLSQRAASQPQDLYTGVKVTSVDDDVLAKIWQSNTVNASELPIETFPNEIVVIPRSENNENTTVIRRVNETYKNVKFHHDVFGLTPRNKEQNFALDLLLDNNIKLVSMTGNAGCGKTLIALAAGLQQTLGSKPLYDKLVVTRPIEPLGKDIGFLPGTMMEKMEPWIAPIKDNLSFLLSHKTKGKNDKMKNDPYIDLLFQEGKIEIEAITYIRGRSIPNSFIIIDEAQNLTIHQLKTIITRIGENTKIVLCGDINQIDVTHMDAVSNGLSYVIEKFKSYELAGHVTLIKGERSQIATIASEIL